MRRLIEAAGFVNFEDDEPTALVNQEPVALDLLAVRGLSAKPIRMDFRLASIPSEECPSDHIPKLAYIEVD